MHRTIWIELESICRRSSELCRYLNLKPVMLKSGKPKYFAMAFQLFSLLLKVKPGVVFVARMPIALLATFAKPILGYALVVDCHYCGIVPNPSLPRLLHGLYPYIHRHADLVLVTNMAHAEVVRDEGGTPFVLQDKIPSLSNDTCLSPPSNIKKVVFICSYSSDEPLDEILSAARMLIREDIQVYLTGNSEGKINCFPPNVTLTGYLPEDEYWELLTNANVIVDLTTRENCLVCGAYEAVALCKPMVLSNTDALRWYFSAGVVYTENFGSAIAESIRTALSTEDQLASELVDLKEGLQAKWDVVGDNLKSTIRDLSLSKRIGWPL